MLFLNIDKNELSFLVIDDEDELSLMLFID
jgi:hypothetical protein